MKNPSMPILKSTQAHTATAEISRTPVEMTGHSALTARNQLSLLPSHQDSTTRYIISKIARTTPSRKTNTKVSQPDPEKIHSPASDIPAINDIPITTQALTAARGYIESSNARTGDQSDTPTLSEALIQDKGTDTPDDQQYRRPPVSDNSRRLRAN